ncbi:hypothetical protein ABK040_013495 [Willaertia magna]
MFFYYTKKVLNRVSEIFKAQRKLENILAIGVPTILIGGFVGIVKIKKYAAEKVKQSEFDPFTTILIENEERKRNGLKLINPNEIEDEGLRKIYINHLHREEEKKQKYQYVDMNFDEEEEDEDDDE